MEQAAWGIVNIWYISVVYSFFFLGVSKKGAFDIRGSKSWHTSLYHLNIQIFIYIYIYIFAYHKTHIMHHCCTCMTGSTPPKTAPFFAGSKGPFPRAPCQSRRTYTTVQWNWCRWFRSPGGLACRSFFGDPPVVLAHNKWEFDVTVMCYLGWLRIFWMSKTTIWWWEHNK